jgi:hypothetical protein
LIATVGSRTDVIHADLGVGVLSWRLHAVVAGPWSRPHPPQGRLAGGTGVVQVCPDQGCCAVCVLYGSWCSCGARGVGGGGIHVCVDGHPESAAEWLAALVPSREGTARIDIREHNQGRNDCTEPVKGCCTNGPPSCLPNHLHCTSREGIETSNKKMSTRPPDMWL